MNAENALTEEKKSIILHNQSYQMQVVHFQLHSYSLFCNSLLAVGLVHRAPSFCSEYFQKFKNVRYGVNIWNQHRKCLKMSTNKPMFGPVVLEITCGTS